MNNKTPKPQTPKPHHLRDNELIILQNLLSIHFGFFIVYCSRLSNHSIKVTIEHFPYLMRFHCVLAFLYFA
jgi:hypothetical protein